MQKTSVILLLMLCGGLLSGCFLFGSDDDNPQPQPINPVDLLPPLTTEGKGTFGCLVNGEAFVSRYPDALADYTVFDRIEIGADRTSPSFGSIGIVISNYNGGEKVFIYPSSDIQSFFIDSGRECSYFIDNNINGYVQITEFNPFDEYISGTFEYTAVNETCDTVRITDGRFDLPLVW